MRTGSTGGRKAFALGLCALWLAALATGASSQAQSLDRPLSPPGKYTFAPNQLAANQWYQPGGGLINGHITESFGREELWPGLRTRLKTNHGALGIPAAEIGFMTSGTLARFRAEGLRVSVETPAFTQCLSGAQIADLELAGRSPPGRNLFQTIFHVAGESGRTDPTGKGWFVTRDGQSYTPDEVVLDERVPNLLASFDLDTLLRNAATQGWAARKAAARHDPCAAASAFHPGVDRLTGLLGDYLAYHSALAARFKAPPAFSFHWNVNAGWEWRDEPCLDALAQKDPDPKTFEHDYRYLAGACHRDSATLARLLDQLCAAHACPFAVYLDMDLVYLTPYAIDAIQRDKAVIRAHGVAFGIDLTDECDGKPGCVDGLTSVDHFGVVPANSGSNDNGLDQQTIVNTYDFLRRSGVIDADTHVRIQSWSTRPHEVGAAVSEKSPGSFANTALYLFANRLEPEHLAATSTH